MDNACPKVTNAETKTTMGSPRSPCLLQRSVFDNVRKHILGDGLELGKEKLVFTIKLLKKCTHETRNNRVSEKPKFLPNFAAQMRNFTRKKNTVCFDVKVRCLFHKRNKVESTRTILYDENDFYTAMFSFGRS